MTFMKNFKNWLIIGLVIFGGILLWKNDSLKNKINTIEVKNGVLEKELKSKIEINRTQVKYVYRDSSGTVKTVGRDIPSGGSVKIVTPNDGEKLKLNLFDRLTTDVLPISSNTFVLIKHSGFTFSPALAFLYDFNDFTIGLETRLIFIRSFGAGPGISPRYFYVFVDYNLASIKMDNTFLGLFLTSSLNPGAKISLKF